MRNIAFLIIVIITVAIAVSCNIQKPADTDSKETPVSEQQEKGSVETPKMFTKVIEHDNNDVLNRISSLEEALTQKIDGLTVNVDNTEVLNAISAMKQEQAADIKDIKDTLTAQDTYYKKQIHQIYGALAAVVAALVIILLLIYRYLKKFIAESMIINSYKNSNPQQNIEPSATPESENAVVSAVNKTAGDLTAKISGAKYLFDPEKAVKLDTAQKAALTEINADTAFLSKAGCDLTSTHSYLMALEKVNEKNYSEASAILEGVKSADENYSPAYFLCGYIAYVSRKYSDAMLNLAKACELEPENAAYLISYGNACLKEKAYDKASEALKKAVALRPDDASAWNNLAHAYIVSEKTEDAVEAFRKAAEAKPDFHEALHNLGLALGRLEKYEEALEAFEKAIKAKDDKHESMYNAACVYAILGKRDGALNNLKKAIELNTEYAAKAKKDKDFASFKDDDEFLKIVG